MTPLSSEGHCSLSHPGKLGSDPPPQRRSPICSESYSASLDWHVRLALPGTICTPRLPTAQTGPLLVQMGRRQRAHPASGGPTVTPWGGSPQTPHLGVLALFLGTTLSAAFPKLTRALGSQESSR